MRVMAQTSRSIDELSARRMGFGHRVSSTLLVDTFGASGVCTSGQVKGLTFGFDDYRWERLRGSRFLGGERSPYQFVVFS
jgi:hypothetical protein